jgi:hypothetical protein
MVNIEELILHGFEPSDRYQISESLLRELGRLFAGQSLPTSFCQGAEVAHLDGGELTLAPGVSAEAIGAQVAQAVYGGLKR